MSVTCGKSEVFSRYRTPVSSINKTDRHDITEILLKVALNTIKQTNKQTSNQQKLVCVFLQWNQICAVFFIICLFMYCHWRSSYQEWRVGIFSFVFDELSFGLLILVELFTTTVLFKLSFHNLSFCRNILQFHSSTIVIIYISQNPMFFR